MVRWKKVQLKITDILIVFLGLLWPRKPIQTEGIQDYQHASLFSKIWGLGKKQVTRIPTQTIEYLESKTNPLGISLV